VDLYERRGDPRSAGHAGGRSINLALSHRGIRALESVELADRVMADAIAMRGRCIHDEKGCTTVQPYSGRPDRHINSVSRAGLNCTLLDGAQDSGVTMHFDADIASVDPNKSSITLRSGETIQADLLIGADGAPSQVRAAMIDAGHTSVTQDMLEHGYKELHIPPGQDGSWPLEKEVLHIWPKGGSMMIALPNPDGSFTCTLFWPLKDAAVSFAKGTAAHVRREYPDAAALMPSLDEHWATNPVGELGTIRCTQWQVGGRTLLLGDAAHAIVPFFGQGMNAGFEDVRMLGEALDAGIDIETFAQTRKPETDAIADLALHNFIEMRDHTASSLYVTRHRLAQWLDRHGFGPMCTPLYELVTFTDMPYAHIRRIQRSRRVVPAVFTLGIAALIAGIISLLFTLLIWMF
jgi:kynurenine 3-monooxygenase